VDNRQQQLETWLSTALKSAKFTLTTASADASFRRYFRVHVADKTLIAMDAPPTHESCTPFVQVAQLLAEAGFKRT
jgi:aminoglycoside/choline kinase family phosphotransferase